MITEIKNGELIITHPTGVKQSRTVTDLDAEKIYLQNRTAELNDQIVGLDIDIAQLKASKEG